MPFFVPASWSESFFSESIASVTPARTSSARISTRCSTSGAEFTSVLTKSITSRLNGVGVASDCSASTSDSNRTASSLHNRKYSIAPRTAPWPSSEVTASTANSSSTLVHVSTRRESSVSANRLTSAASPHSRCSPGALPINAFTTFRYASSSSGRASSDCSTTSIWWNSAHTRLLSNSSAMLPSSSFFTKASTPSISDNDADLVDSSTFHASIALHSFRSLLLPPTRDSLSRRPHAREGGRLPSDDPRSILTPPHPWRDPSCLPAQRARDLIAPCLSLTSPVLSCRDSSSPVCCC
mmetsp:Transcript_8829/g.27990  ORF Transcript_8829/g.27990 Transcript_8829/m.27990 type:complete len:296 (+) Transcript_8829:711-1598(+)